ncbi:DNA-binding MarR family transcriptional regulator [Rhizobium sp. SG741]|nr:DNA-binding MarR family transcriptional regulator [Rhizobium sp. SG741]
MVSNSGLVLHLDADDRRSTGHLLGHDLGLRMVRSPWIDDDLRLEYFTLDNTLISSYFQRMTQELDFQARLLVDRSCFGLNIHRAGRAVAKKFDDAFRNAGVNHWQFALLMTVNVPGGMSVSELARSLVVDRTTITANVKPLERMGLISIKVDEDDARARRIEITKSGIAVLEETYPLWQAVNAEISSAVASDKDGVLNALAIITARNA